MGNDVSRPFEQIAREMSQPFEQIARGVSQPIEQIAREVSQPIEQIARGVSQPIEQIARGVSLPIEQIARGVSQPIEQIARGVSQPIEQIARGVSQPIEQIARGVSQPIEQIARGVSQPIGQVARVVSNHIEKGKLIQVERDNLGDLLQRCGCYYPGCEYRSSDRKKWMADLDPRKLIINKIVWPGTHNSATNGIGIPLITRPFAECQTLSIYEQLVKGVRLLDVRVQEDRRICHGPLKSYSVGVVLEDVKRFLAETVSEIIILEIRTEFGHNDPPEFDKYLEEMLEDYLIPQDDNVFGNAVAEVLPKRVICIWKPRNSGVHQTGSLLWSGGYLKDDWVDTDLPLTKFQSNLDRLGEQPTVSARKFFYRVENTLTPQPDNPGLYLTALTGWINGYARLFIAQCLSKGIADRLQVLSTDFVEDDFVDACVGLTYARVEGTV